MMKRFRVSLEYRMRDGQDLVRANFLLMFF